MSFVTFFKIVILFSSVYKSHDITYRLCYQSNDSGTNIVLFYRAVLIWGLATAPEMTLSPSHPTFSLTETNDMYSQ